MSDTLVLSVIARDRRLGLFSCVFYCVVFSWGRPPLLFKIW